MMYQAAINAGFDFRRYAMSGDGLQSVYLAAVPEPMAKVLLDQMPGFSLAVLDTARISGDDDGVVRTVDDAIEKVIQNDTSSTRRNARQ